MQTAVHTKKYRKITALLFPAMVVVIFLTFAPEIRASFLQNTIGWIWGGMDQTGGGNTSVGWVSLNSRDCDDDGNGTVDAAEAAASPGCPMGLIVDYGVNIPQTDGALSGYAWSENYGWISFNAADVTGCPTGSCPPVRVGNAIRGWARILSIRDAGANAGGWTGFLKLASDGTDTVSYGVVLNSNNDLSNYAYSDEVGWIDFATAGIRAAKRLWVCQDSCSSNIVRGEAGTTTSFVMSTQDSQMLVACFTGNINCNDASPAANVSNTSTTWTDTGNNPNDAVFFSSEAPGRRLNPNSGGGVESISVTHNGQTATMNVTVSCTETNDCTLDPLYNLTCKDEPFTIPSSCTGKPVLNCLGDRVCDNNWQEIAP